MGSLDQGSLAGHEDKGHSSGTESVTQKSDFIRVAKGGSFAGVSGVAGVGMLSGGVCRSIKTVLFSSKLNLLMPFGPVAILVHFLTGNEVSNRLY